MSDLSDLYQQVILDHNKSPRNFGRPENVNREAEGFNPLCGDRITVFLNVEDDKINEVGFQGSGCAICTASASMMTTSVKGKSKEEAEALQEKFHEMVTSSPGEPVNTDELGKLAVFSGVCEFPTRIKCATLSWHTLQAALEHPGVTVSMEE